VVMDIQQNVPLAPLTALAVGGPAERLVTVTTTDQLLECLKRSDLAPFTVLGYGANVLVSDAGLSGTTLIVHSQQITQDGTTFIADAGVWWDDLVQAAIAQNLWGLELTSGIPGSVGAAVVGNIAAYGQAVSDTLAWVEVFDPIIASVRRLEAAELKLSYRFSDFQTNALKHLTIIRAAFSLKSEPITELTYQSALDIAQTSGYDTTTLAGRRQTILETRKKAGSLWDYRDTNSESHTAGSFFRNPLVDAETAEKIMSYDETGKSLELLKQMNLVHGGEQKRVSAAHVLLAAGFQRGQTWGSVRLHPDHILKIENTGGATAQQIYNVAQEIISTVKAKLGVDLVPEVRFLGNFTQ
jgi:UDP-N-acetylmuramate dehydrogenase